MKRWACVVVGLVVALVTLVPALAACGAEKATSDDPFVGTWREQESDGALGQTPMVITKSGDGYVLTIVYMGADWPASPRPAFTVPMTREGNKLSGTLRLVGPFEDPVRRVEIVYLPDFDDLTFANSRTSDGPLNTPGTMVRVSQGTVYPTTL